MNELEQRINDLIPTGKEKPISAKELASITKIDKRVIKAIIHRLIVKYHVGIVGVRIGNYGYYKPANAEEMREAIQPLQAQINSENKRLSVLRDILRTLESGTDDE